MSKLKLLDEIARIKNIDGFQSDAWKSIDLTSCKKYV